MTATIIDGKAIAATIQDEVRAEVDAILASGRRAPSLHVVLCGEDPASASYVRSKGRACTRVGIDSTTHQLAGSTTTAELLDLLAQLNGDATVDAILVQLPLPRQIDTDAVLLAVATAKDVDGFSPANFGMLAQGRDVIAPCTPRGCMELLARYKIPIEGAHAVVVGRSVIVGRPMAVLLTNASATVTIAHSKTRDLAAVCRQADILISAIGRPGLIGATHVKPGACVIDVGTTRVDDQLRGDVDFDAVLPIAGWLTPVPKGVGPMTIATLLRNTVTLARAQAVATTAASGV